MPSIWDTVDSCVLSVNREGYATAWTLVNVGLCRAFLVLLERIMLAADRQYTAHRERRASVQRRSPQSGFAILVGCRAGSRCMVHGGSTECCSVPCEHDTADQSQDGARRRAPRRVGSRPAERSALDPTSYAAQKCSCLGIQTRSHLAFSDR